MALKQMPVFCGRAGVLQMEEPLLDQEVFTFAQVLIRSIFSNQLVKRTD